MSRWLGLGLVLLAGGALALRGPQLDRRPMHADESVHAEKFRGLWEKGSYRYDPDEYHGPSLYYATLPAAWLSGARDFSQITERTLRWVPVVFGVACVLVLWWLRDGLGTGGTLWAALFTAVSPAMGFYSRYYIHEMLLLFFTLLLMAAAWRYLCRPSLGWALLAGAALGLMQATKETFVIAIGSMVVALVLTLLYGRWVDGDHIAIRGRLNGRHLVAAGLTALVVSVVLFASCFTNWRGPLDSLLTYFPWLRRAGGSSQHLHPWYYYLGLLAYTHRAKGPVWSEGLVLVLALAGIGFALLGKAESRRQKAEEGNVEGKRQKAEGTERRAGAADYGLRSADYASTLQRFNAPRSEDHSALRIPHSPFNMSWSRFLSFYTLSMIVVYSAVRYKTPWCLLGFLQGLVLLAGIGAGGLLRLCPAMAGKVVLAVALLAATGQLTTQAIRTNYAYCADQRNPYVYAQTVEDVLNLAQKVAGISRADPKGREMVIKVMVTREPPAGGAVWPLPWYLRQFPNVGYYQSVPEDAAAPLVIASPNFESRLEGKLGQTHLMTGFFGFRPSVFLELWVEKNLWQQYLKDRPPDSD